MRSSSGALFGTSSQQICSVSRETNPAVPCCDQTPSLPKLIAVTSSDAPSRHFEDHPQTCEHSRSVYATLFIADRRRHPRGRHRAFARSERVPTRTCAQALLLLRSAKTTSELRGTGTYSELLRGRRRPLSCLRYMFHVKPTLSTPACSTEFSSLHLSRQTRARYPSRTVTSRHPTCGCLGILQRRGLSQPHLHVDHR